jgi:hypothetical protein
MFINHFQGFQIFEEVQQLKCTQRRPKVFERLLDQFDSLCLDVRGLIRKFLVDLGPDAFAGRIKAIIPKGIKDIDLGLDPLDQLINPGRVTSNSLEIGP